MHAIPRCLQGKHVSTQIQIELYLNARIRSHLTWNNHISSAVPWL